MVLENGDQQLQPNNDEAIRLPAYYIYLDRIYEGRDGDEVGDWHAKQEIDGVE